MPNVQDNSLPINVDVINPSDFTTYIRYPTTTPHPYYTTLTSTNVTVTNMPDATVSYLYLPLGFTVDSFQLDFDFSISPSTTNYYDFMTLAALSTPRATPRYTYINGIADVTSVFAYVWNETGNGHTLILSSFLNGAWYSASGTPVITDNMTYYARLSRTVSTTATANLSLWTVQGQREAGGTAWVSKTINAPINPLSIISCAGSFNYNVTPPEPVMNGSIRNYIFTA